MKPSKARKYKLEPGSGMFYKGKRGAVRYIENPLNVWASAPKHRENKFNLYGGKKTGKVRNYEIVLFDCLDDVLNYIDTLPK